MRLRGRQRRVACAGLALVALVGVAPPLSAAEDPSDADLLQEARELKRATRFEESRAAFEELVARGERSGNVALAIDATLGLCDLERDSGNAAGGLVFCDRALELFAPGVEPELEARIYRQRAQVRTALRDMGGASADLDSAAAIYSGLGLAAEVAGVDATRSVMATWVGAWDDAVRYGRAALPTLIEHGKMSEAVGALSGVAYGLQELGRHEEALDAYDRLIELAFERNDQRVLNFAFCNRATVRWALHQNKASEDDLRRAIEGIEETRRRIRGDPESRRDYFGAQRSAYDDLVLLLAETHRGTEAFSIAERFHGRSLLELLDEADLDQLVQDPELRRRERELLSAIGAARLEEAEPGEGGSTSKLESLRAELRALRAQQRRADPRYAELVAPEPAQPAEVQETLEEGEVLVAYWVGKGQTFAWAITGEKVHFVVIPVSRELLEDSVARYLAPLRSPELALDAALKGTEDEHVEIGKSLYRWLVGSLPGSVRRAGRMIFVQDDFLHYLPFEALIEECDPEADAEADAVHAIYAGCRFLGLEAAIGYAPSAGVLRALRRRAESVNASSLLAMAPYDRSGLEPATERAAGGAFARLGTLSHSGDELDRIAESHPSPSLHLGRRATEATFKASAGGFARLHLATHGLIDDDRPMSSGVLLHPDRGEDGLLQADEVLGLDLDAELVTLSACRTGRGALNHGEGIVGLSRSFLHAGARSVVVSMWDVDDRSTPVLMASFYAGLAKGQRPSEALLAARRALFSQTGSGRLVTRTREIAWAHPRYWAPFVVNGGDTLRNVALTW